MKIYTKTGDKGKTSLVSGTKISKGDLRIELYGEVDELNSCLGIVLSSIESKNELKAQFALLSKIQHALFDLGSNLACEADKRAKYKLPTIKTVLITGLEESIDQMQEELPALKNFILPGGALSASFTHLARTVCRRAERKLVNFFETNKDESFENSIEFLNRLSDFLFVLSRYINLKAGTNEVTWSAN
ncbi:MAG: cob(I)yrinic acid a,c-diamide adenosyltransferase [Bacteriovoracaceae bacterium]|nr:cob(I)yrinic acid a,c-diamide adenosyltransferase [Bacteriovoracaceae bacterium]